MFFAETRDISPQFVDLFVGHVGIKRVERKKVIRSRLDQPHLDAGFYLLNSFVRVHFIFVGYAGMTSC